MNIKPCNRHLLIEEYEPEEKKESRFLLPDDYKTSRDPFMLVKVLAIADDCEKITKKDILVVVPTNMVETLEVFDKYHKIVQENYVNLIVEV